MALLWIDGFDHYGSGLISSTLTGYGSYAQAQLAYAQTTPTPRTGTYCLRAAELRRVFGGAKTAVGVGFAFYMDELPGVDDDLELMTFRNANGDAQCRLTINPTGTVALYTSASTKQAESGIVIVAGQWYHIEANFVPNGSSSSMEVRLNETTLFTKNPFTITGTPSNETSIFSLDQGVTINYWYIDDLYAWDTSGSNNNTWIGDKKVHTMMPNGDSAVADWTPNSGGVEYTQIDEIGPDGDTSYVYTGAGTNVRSEYDFASMPTNTNIVNGVFVVAGARKTDAGTADFRVDIVSGASESTGTSTGIGTSYTYYDEMFETDPATGALWTKSGVDGAKIRIVRTG